MDICGSLKEEIRTFVEDERSGSKKNSVAILIPSNNSSEFLHEHLCRLDRQEFGGFDVIVILGKDDRYLNRKGGVNILQYRRKLDFGCAGGFYIAEKIAYCLGYDCMIMTDVDCYPERDTVVGSLVRDTGQDAVCRPLCREFDMVDPALTATARYMSIPRGAFEKCGFSVPYFYFNGEELEYLAVLKSYYKIKITNDLVSHPSKALEVISKRWMMHNVNAIVALRIAVKRVLGARSPPMRSAYLRMIPILLTPFFIFCNLSLMSVLLESKRRQELRAALLRSASGYVRWFEIGDVIDGSLADLTRYIKPPEEIPSCSETIARVRAPFYGYLTTFLSDVVQYPFALGKREFTIKDYRALRDILVLLLVASGKKIHIRLDKDVRYTYAGEERGPLSKAGAFLFALRLWGIYLLSLRKRPPANFDNLFCFSAWTSPRADSGSPPISI